MTKQEKNAEIERLVPYCIHYAKQFLRTTDGALLLEHYGGDPDDFFAEAQLCLVEHIEKGLPPQFLKNAVKWQLWRVFGRMCKQIENERGGYDEAFELVVDPTAVVERVPSFMHTLRLAVFKATTDCPFLVRAAVRTSILKNCSMRETGCAVTRSMFYFTRTRILEKIKIELENCWREYKSKIEASRAQPYFYKV